MKKILAIISFLFLGIFGLHSQQLPLYNQYMLNGYLINPAVAGSDGYTTLNLTARAQWVGMPDAPNSQVFSFQSRLLKKSFKIRRMSANKSALRPSRKGKVGLGGYVFNDLNGSVSRTGVHFSYAYHLRIHNSQLSFGLGGTAYQFHIRQLQFYDENEPLITEGINKPVFVPDADFGVYYLAYNFWAGASVKNLLQSYLKLGNKTLEDFRLLRHYYFTGGYRFELANGLDLEPSALFKFSSQLIPQLDVNLKAYYAELYWAGISLRTNGSFVTMFGIVVDRFYFGYAFDLEFNSIRKRTFGSHEFMISMKIGASARRYRWLDRY